MALPITGTGFILPTPTRSIHGYRHDRVDGRLQVCRVILMMRRASRCRPCPAPWQHSCTVGMAQPLHGLLLVALEILKELPATMLLQPFQLKTLAVSLHQEVQQESLSGAAAPALVLVAAGLFAITLTTVIHFGRERRQ